jgi:curved DNA-binding protein CbpA
MSASLLDYLRILDLENNPDFTLNDLKKAFRKKILEVHPDKGGKSNDFDYLLSAFIYINNAICRVKGGRTSLEEIKSPDELKSDRIEEFIESIFEEYNNEIFNREFEKTHVSDINDGYANWLSEYSESESSELDKSMDYQQLLNSVRITKSEELSENNDINNLFIKKAKEGKIEPESIILHPNEMAYYTGVLTGTNILSEKPESYSSEFLATPEYTDLYHAFTKDNIICDKVSHNIINKTFDDIIKERSEDIKPFTDEEKLILLEYEKKKLENEKQRMEKVKEQFGSNFIITTHLLGQSDIKSKDDNFIMKIE